MNRENDREKTFKIELISIKKILFFFISFDKHNINLREFKP